MILQRLEPKCLGKKEENGVSTPHVLKIRPYAHIKAKHAKKNFKSKHVILPFQKHNAMSSKSYQPTKLAYYLKHII